MEGIYKRLAFRWKPLGNRIEAEVSALQIVLKGPEAHAGMGAGEGVMLNAC